MVTSRTLAAIAIPSLLAAQDGFRPVIGGLPSDSGIALGVEYRKSGAGGRVIFETKAIGSSKKYEFLEARIRAPFRGLLFVEARSRYRNYPEEDFWGLGPKSAGDRRTTFRMEDIDFAASLGIRPARWFEAGATAGGMNVNAGPGKDEEWPSIEQIFTPAEAPALDRQPDYAYGGAFVRVDYRDEAGDPQQGGMYEFRWTTFHDRDFDAFGFRRYQIDLRQFVPSFRHGDTVAIRALAIFTGKREGQQAPFFMQPTVGGGSDLRGYLQYRFRDENALVFNLEYRWRVRDMLQIVGFADAGRVFSRPGAIGLSGMRGSAGVGARFKLFERVLLGVDLGLSPDGLRTWFRGSHTF